MIRRLTKAERQAKSARQARHRRLYRKSPLGKGPSRKTIKAEKDADEAAVIAETRAKVWARTRDCELCGWRIAMTDGGQMHEDPSRAQSRGRPALERFNERVCCRACGWCHADQTEKRSYVDFDDPIQGFQGGYTVRRWADDSPLFRQEARP